MGLNGHENPTNAIELKSKARSLSKLIGNYGQYGFEGASNLTKVGTIVKSVSIVTKG